MSLNYFKKKHVGMKASREQHVDEMKKTATLPSAYGRMLTFRMYLLLTVIHQPVSMGDDQAATCL